MFRRVTSLFRTDAVQRVTERESGSSRGQVLVLFALMLTVLIGMTAFVVDLAWIWSHQLKVQRAADAGALAGVVWLPGNEPSAQTAANAAATANGYTNGVGGATVDAHEDPTNDNRIVVDISAPVETFFMQLFGVNTVTVARTARAEYVQPVPMGSPENYYGVFGPMRTPPGEDTGWRSASVNKATASDWASINNVYVSDDLTATTTIGKAAWGNFGITLPGGATVTGIEVGIEARYTGSSSGSCRFNVNISGENGANYSSLKLTPNMTTTDPVLPYYVLGADNDRWGKASGYWTAARLSDANFRVQLEREGCSRTRHVDRLRVRIHYTLGTPPPDPNLAGPPAHGSPVLTPRGFWGTMLQQGSEDINGDAYSPMYEDRTSALNPDYLPAKYYDYAVEVQVGTSNGEVWIFDPVHCAVDPQYGTGDRWFGSGSSNLTSAFYYLYDTHETLFDTSDDTRADPLGDDNLFKHIRASDTSLGGPSISGGIQSCQQGDVTDPADGRYWHNRWWQLASGLEGGHTYRVRTTTTDPNSASDQNNADGENSFAIWTTAVGADAPKVYGIGAMQAYTPLKAAQTSLFYLAQIDAIHAGKTVRIELWDPGDTGSLPATLSILIPTATGYSPATFDWTAAEGSTNNNANCLQSAGAGVTSVMATSSGGVQQFQGCWVTIEIPIPDNYTAPTPPGEQEGGWWKINYAMGGSGSGISSDVTTWQVEIRGNPVHLVVP